MSSVKDVNREHCWLRAAQSEAQLRFAAKSGAPGDGRRRAPRLKTVRFRKRGAKITVREGSQIHTNSFKITVAPAELKKPQPTGDDTIGRHGRKYRCELNGAKKATPNVPSTMASNTQCDTVARKRRAKMAGRPIPLTGFLKAVNTTRLLRTAAKRNE
ncbi:MAG TPA: hypothetical protein VFV34_25815 [Blastocatellia bacterium]|nr:hypothetical protein [Blastocatellia bacterium]